MQKTVTYQTVRTQGDVCCEGQRTVALGGHAYEGRLPWFVKGEARMIWKRQRVQSHQGQSGVGGCPGPGFVCLFSIPPGAMVKTGPG